MLLDTLQTDACGRFCGYVVLDVFGCYVLDVFSFEVRCDVVF